ncbi:MAG: NlpC/P60 family protein [Hyphomicrobiaceae bacterium]|nr:NlpC/P60 family protein [Hyphomicrobiaceae bacterium]
MNQGSRGARPLRRRPDGSLDVRRHAVRPDLAAENLRDTVESPSYAAGHWAQVVHASAPVRRRPAATAALDTEALHGEVVVVYEEAEGWSWVQLLRDDYVGYMPSSALSQEVAWGTHRVRSIGTFVYPDPDIKAPPLAHLSLNSMVTVTGTTDAFSELARGGFIVTRHLADEGTFSRDFVEVAERFIGTPYLWGGRTRLGIDCSGLVQVAMEAAGTACPRDSDMQQAETGTTVLIPETLDGLKRGDLVFWPGHVGIMSDGLMLVHANAHQMSVTVETLPEAVERIARSSGSKPTAIKRLDTYTV